MTPATETHSKTYFTGKHRYKVTVDGERVYMDRNGELVSSIPAQAV